LGIAVADQEVLFLPHLQDICWPKLYNKIISQVFLKTAILILKRFYMLNYGIEIEYIVKFASISDMMQVIEQHQDILIRNKYFREKTFLFTDPSINPVYNNKNFESLFDCGFEIKTKKLEFNEANFNNFKQLFEDLSRVVFTNATCGLHVHCSRKWFSLKDHFALLYEYLKNQYYEEFLEIEGHPMSSPSYANLNRTKSYYYNRINKAINNKSTIIIDTTAFERKVDLYKVHLDYNSIEFRGLRGHFSKCSNASILSAVKEYLNIMETLRYDKNIKNIFSWEED